jgi:hypothetical protein
MADVFLALAHASMQESKVKAFGEFHLWSFFALAILTMFLWWFWRKDKTRTMTVQR